MPRKKTKKKLRGPFPIEELAAAVDVSVEEIKRFQQQGLIPRRREWTEGPAMFYKPDINRIEKAKQQTHPQDARR
tara:strand:- start:600 stop:824 length:225 start_codon:yes stop_codon:yes gene_type:complete